MFGRQRDIPAACARGTAAFVTKVTKHAEITKLSCWPLTPTREPVPRIDAARHTGEFGLLAGPVLPDPVGRDSRSSDRGYWLTRFLCRPLPPDRIRPVPVHRGGADRVKDTHPRRRGIRHLDHRSGMAFLAEVNEPPARTVTFLTDRVTTRQRALVDRIVISRPTGPMLHPLASGGQKLPIHAGCLASLLDQLELHVTRIGQRDRRMQIVVSIPVIGEGGDHEFVGVKPRTDPADVSPVSHRAF